MINFKDPKDQTSSAFAVLGMILIGVAVVVSLFFNRSVDAKAYARNARKDLVAFKTRTDSAKESLSGYEDTIGKYLWTEKEDSVTPAALELISQKTQENHLKLVSFRPLKSFEGASLIQLPLQFTVDGSFASVAAMLQSFETTDSKLAVQQVQFASQEGETDLVSANVSLVAFLAKPMPVKKGSKTSTTSSAPAGTNTSPRGATTKS